MASILSTVGELFGSVHQNLRELVESVDEEGLNWSPGPEMNSIAVLVVHTVGSELDTFHLVGGTTGDRDRDAEFALSGATKADLLAALDRADAQVAQYTGTISDDDLEATRERPGRDPQTGLHWLLNNYGHAREHLGHASLTAQLWKARG